MSDNRFDVSQNIRPLVERLEAMLRTSEPGSGDHERMRLAHGFLMDAYAALLLDVPTEQEVIWALNALRFRND